MSSVKEEDVVEYTLPETSTGEKRKREGRLRSKAWAHFKKLEKRPGQRDECMCIHCKKVFTCSKTTGTTHLNRHIFLGLCPVYKKLNVPECAIPISYSVGCVKHDNNATVRPHKFDEERALQDLAELIINWELPFDFVEDPSFQKYISGICPNYSFVSKDLLRSSCIKRYGMEKDILKEILRGSNSRVSLTIDTWTSGQDLPYMALRVHFIDNSWKIHRKIINFFTTPSLGTGQDLAGIATNCLREWNIEKICAITLEHSTKNDVLALTLSHHCSSRGLLLRDNVFQVHCWGHVLSLIVQDGLKEFGDSIHRVRKAVKYVKVSAERKVELLQYADHEHISQDKMLVLDIPTQWDSTYKMIDSALHYKKAYDCMRSNDPHFKDPPTPEDWEKAKIVRHFLETFIIVSKKFSGKNKCTANIFFREVYRIVKLLRDTSTDLSSLLGRMALSILDKFEKYWAEKEPNILLSIAVVLDPRFKLKYLKFCYSKIYDSCLIGDLMCRVEVELRKLFDMYVVKFEASSLIDDTSTRDKSSPSMPNSSFLDITTDFMEEFYKFTEEEETLPAKTELDVYLEEKLHRNTLSSDEDEFDILQWWKASSSRFKVLSKMARDILAIPVSSISSDSACGNGDRVLNSFRSSLLPSTAEALVCAQDWIRNEPVQSKFEEEMDMAFSAPKMS